MRTRTMGRPLRAAMVGGLAAAVALAAPAAAAACGASQQHGPVANDRPGPAPLAVGDSVMLGAVPQLRRAGFEVNARGCRQMSEGLELLAGRRRLAARRRGRGAGLQLDDLDRGDPARADDPRAGAGARDGHPARGVRLGTRGDPCGGPPLAGCACRCSAGPPVARASRGPGTACTSPRPARAGSPGFSAGPSTGRCRAPSRSPRSRSPPARAARSRPDQRRMRSRRSARITSVAASEAPVVFRCTPSGWRTRTVLPPICIESR